MIELTDKLKNLSDRDLLELMFVSLIDVKQKLTCLEGILKDVHTVEYIHHVNRTSFKDEVLEILDKHTEAVEELGEYLAGSRHI